MKLYNGIVLYNENEVKTKYGRLASSRNKGGQSFAKKAWPKPLSKRDASILNRKLFKARCQSSGAVNMSMAPFSTRIATKSFEISKERGYNGRPKSSRVTFLGLKAKVNKLNYNYISLSFMNKLY